jgi:phage FluMu protein Com
MKIIEGPHDWWIGKRIQCTKCNIIFVLESQDKKGVKEKRYQSDIGFSFERDFTVAEVLCPKCKNICETPK